MHNHSTIYCTSIWALHAANDTQPWKATLSISSNTAVWKKDREWQYTTTVQYNKQQYERYYCKEEQDNFYSRLWEIARTCIPLSSISQSALTSQFFYSLVCLTCPGNIILLERWFSLISWLLVESNANAIVSNLSVAFTCKEGLDK